MRTKIISLLFLAALLSSCKVTEQQVFKSSFKDINSFNKQKKDQENEPFLKAHLKSGGLCIYTDTIWQYNETTNLINGNGKLYTMQRDLIKNGIVELNLDSVVLFESNRKLNMENRKNRMAALTILTTADATLGVICVTVPKACWGSCPTFYSGQGNYLFSADAEGFSEAIVPSMEYGDIDALYNFKPLYQDFSIKMKNEALETHVVRKVSILALEKDPTLTAYHAPDDNFYLTDPFYKKELISAIGDEGDISEILNSLDQNERFSLADKRNMKSREEIILKFNREGIKDAGLILNFRQTLMTTYLIYSAMGYMGNTVSDFLAEVEKNNQSLKKHKLIDEELGGIDVYLINGKEEQFCGSFNETGPIASNLQLVPLSELPDSKEITVKLVLNKGLWRIDYAGLVPVLGKTNTIELKPERIVYKKEDHPEMLKIINDDSKQLISMPGDEFDFYFSLPETENDYDLFLYSKGYYLEWMRESWLDDKDLFRLRHLIQNPDKFFRKEARKYSKYESQMEEIFWSSRIDTEKFN